MAQNWFKPVPHAVRREGHFDQTLFLKDQTVEAIDEETLYSAMLVVCGRLDNKEDASEVLQALGLIDYRDKP